MSVGPRPRLTARGASMIAAGVVVVLAAVYVAATANSGRAASDRGAEPGSIRFVEQADGSNLVTLVDPVDPEHTRQPTGLHCLRYYSANGIAVCLGVAGVGPTYAAKVLDRNDAVMRTVALPGVPSRARVSPSGNIVAWTSFVTGDSYSVPGGFSTRTGFVDLRSGYLVESLESFRATISGQAVTAPDVNYWGLTVADDDRTFYATLATGGHTWLVRGDLVDQTVESVVQDAECPSLSPDGSRVAYKKRLGRLGPWELAVLDVDEGAEIRLPGTAGIDDQAEWLDDGRLAYGAVPSGGRTSAIFIVDSNGTTPAQMAIPDAASPSVVR